MSASIAVIVPTRNRERLLARCLDSLQRQTLFADRFTVFVVDDGSTDNTVSMLRSRGMAYKSIPHSGPAVARNKGVRATQSELIVFIDDDAVADPGWLSTVFQAFREGRLRDAAEGDVLRLGDDLPLSHSVHHSGPGGFLTCNLAVTRSCFEKNSGFDERFRHPINEDFDFFIRLRKTGAQLEYLPGFTVRHPVEKLAFWPALKGASDYAQRRTAADALLYRLHPMEYAKVKADDDAWGTLRRLSTRYALTEALRPYSRFVFHPVRGTLWLLVCLARQAAFLRLRLKGGAV
ncbi:MAG: glycosyltransferase family A protein [Fibrobacterota bacterium]